MPSRISLERLAADTDVVLSAAAGGAASRVFRSARGITVVTTEYNYEQMERRLPRIADHFEILISKVAANLKNLPLQIYSEQSYRSHLPEAARYLLKRDATDIPLAALALKLQSPIWSNDNDFKVVPLTRYPTAVLLKMLGL